LPNTKIFQSKDVASGLTYSGQAKPVDPNPGQDKPLTTKPWPGNVQYRQTLNRKYPGKTNPEHEKRWTENPGQANRQALDTTNSGTDATY
jgi:hypothetical protein